MILLHAYLDMEKNVLFPVGYGMDKKPTYKFRATFMGISLSFFFFFLTSEIIGGVCFVLKN